jgi:hypothetical protein
MSGGKGWQVVLGQVGRRQTGGGVLTEDLLQEGRHPGGRRGRRRFDQGGFGGALAVGVAGLVQRIEPGEERAGGGIDEVDLTQVPGGVADVDAGEVSVAGRDFEAPPQEAEGAVAAALGAGDFGGERLAQGVTGGSGTSDVPASRKHWRGVRSSSSRCGRRWYSTSSQAWVASLSWARVRSGTPSSMGRRRPSTWFHHELLLPVLIGTPGQDEFVEDAQSFQSLSGFKGDHGRAVVAHQGPGQSALLKRLTEAVAQLLGPLGEVPLGMAGQPRMIVEHPQEQRIRPAPSGEQDAHRTVVKVQMPEGIDILALVTAHLAGLVPVFRLASPRTMGRPAPGPLEHPVGFQEALDRGVGGDRSERRIGFEADGEVVGVELIAPTRMLAVLEAEPLRRLGRDGGVSTVIGADPPGQRLGRDPGRGGRRSTSVRSWRRRGATVGR